MAQASPRQPLGSQFVPLQQEGAPNFALLVNIAPGVALAVDVTDRPGRQLGIVYGNVGQLLQRAVTGDALVQLRSAGAEIDPRDVSDRAARLVGIIYGSQGQQLLQRAATFETVVQLNQAGAEVAAGNPLPTEDTGVNTNSERWLHDNHWDSGAELVLNAAAAVNLGAAVGAGVTRRVRSITVRNTAQVNTLITLSQVAPAQNRVTFDVPSQTTRVWSEQDGIEFLAGVQVQIASSAAAGGSETYIHAAGVEA